MYEGRLRASISLAFFTLMVRLGVGCAQNAPVMDHRPLPNVSVTILRDNGSTWVEVSNQSGRAVGIPSGLPFLNIWSCEVRVRDGKICSYSPFGERERLGPPCGRSLGVFINPGQKQRFPFPIDKWFELVPTDHHVATVTIPLIRNNDGLDYEITSPPFSMD